MEIMANEKRNRKTISEEEKKNIILLKDIKEKIAIFIKNNMDDNESIPYFVKNSLEMAYIDIALYLEHESEDFDIEDQRDARNEGGHFLYFVNQDEQKQDMKCVYNGCDNQICKNNQVFQLEEKWTSLLQRSFR